MSESTGAMAVRDDLQRRLDYHGISNGNLMYVTADDMRRWIEALDAPESATAARIVAAGDRVVEAAYELDAAELAYTFLSITRRGGLGEARDRRDRAQGALREALIAHNAARAAGAHEGRE